MMTAPLTTERRTTLDDQETPLGEASQLLVPVNQQTIYFYGQPLVVVRLADGRVGAVLRWFCLNLQLDSDAQLRRIRRTEEIADDLVDVRIQTEGGSQAMAALILHAVPFWLAGIDSRRVREEVRPQGVSLGPCCLGFALLPEMPSQHQAWEAGDCALRPVVGTCVMNSWERAAVRACVRGIARPSAHAAANASSPIFERAAATACP